MILEQENLLRDQSNLRLDVVDLKRLAAIKVYFLLTLRRSLQINETIHVIESAHKHNKV